MIVNYLKTAIRNLWRRKAFSLINILGLAVGLTAGFLIFLYVSFEHSYDNFHTKGDRIYRLVTDIKTPSETIHAPITSWPFAPNIKSDFPEVESFVRVNRTNLLMRKGDIKFQEDKALLADSTFFRIFDFKLIEGDAGKVLNAPFNIVLSQSAARRYFGNAKAEGQTIIVNDGELGVVTGV